MDLGKVIASAFGEMVSEKLSETKVRVGRISPELEKEFFDNRNAAKIAEKDINSRIAAFVQELEEEYELLQFENKKMELWEKVYDELALTQEERGLRYTINHDTRVITRIDKKVEEEMEFKL